jgi:hypothetical protein
MCQANNSDFISESKDLDEYREYGIAINCNGEIDQYSMQYILDHLQGNTIALRHVSNMLQYANDNLTRMQLCNPQATELYFIVQYGNQEFTFTRGDSFHPLVAISKGYKLQ